MTQTAAASSREVGAYDEGRIDPAALEMHRRDLEDAAQAYRAVLWGVAFALILIAWGTASGWIGWNVRAWVGR